MTDAEVTLTNTKDINLVLNAEHPDVFSFLGPHKAERKGKKGWSVRVLRPDAKSLKVVCDDNATIDAVKVRDEGLYEAFIPDPSETPPNYRIEWVGFDSEKHSLSADPYRFGPVLGEQDAYFIGEGKHRRLFEVLGAQPKEIEGVKGVSFAVWAPNAKRVSVVGDFNQWDGRIFPMRKRIEAGVWEIFVPDVPLGEHYKYEIVGAAGNLFVKSDPMAFYSQTREKTASITHDLTLYDWKDSAWMEERSKVDVYKKPLSIYEVHLGSWALVPEEDNRNLTYREFADRLVQHVVDLGFTHIELMPVSEFPFDGSWGYQVTGYFSPTSRFGPPDDFRYLVDTCHQNGIGVIVDWVPGHFPKDSHGLGLFDGTHLYEHANPLEGEHKDWGTLIFNFGRTEVRNFLISNALFWMEQYHIDGLRVDAVASMIYRDYSRKEGEWVPNQYGGRENLEALDFLRELNTLCYEEHPGIMMIAEESTAFGGVSKPVETGGLGFGFKWNMGWMHDFLEYMSKEPIHRRFHHDTATFSMIYAYHENFILVLSHDEVVHGKRSLLDKMPGDNWQKFANLRMFFAWMYGHPGKKLLFQAAEVAPFTEWDCEKSVDWHLLQYPEHNGVNRLLKDLNQIYKDEPALYQRDHSHEGFEWVVSHDYENSVFAFLRKGDEGEPILVVINATPVPRPSYRLGIPMGGTWEEILNTDSSKYAGSDCVSSNPIEASEEGYHGRPYSLDVALPPLGTVFFRPVKS